MSERNVQLEVESMVKETLEQISAEGWRLVNATQFLEEGETALFLQELDFDQKMVLVTDEFGQLNAFAGHYVLQRALFMIRRGTKDRDDHFYSSMDDAIYNVYGHLPEGVLRDTVQKLEPEAPPWFPTPALDIATIEGD